MLKYYNLHTHKFLYNQDSCFEVFNLDLYKNLFIPNEIYFSAGLHPWSLNEDYVSWYLYMLRKIARHNFCIAIGECGLDYKKKIDRNFQISIFKKQIEIATDFQLPLILHIVSAHNDVISIKKNYNSNIAWIVHGFNSSETILKQLISNGFYVSVGDVFIKKKSNLLNNIPLDRLFFETDDKDSNINEIYSEASKKLKLSSENLKIQIENNFKKCFNINL